MSAPNHLLETLPNVQLRRMLAGCEVVELSFADVLYKLGGRLRHVYFPTGSCISLVMPIHGSASVEVGLVGREGMLGIPLALGVAVSPVDAIVQGAGPALRMDADCFCRELERSQALEGEINRYVFVYLTQLAQRSACTRFHMVGARLARWLLMTQDRARADTFDLTHQFLASMLGVRRVGITQAASLLQQRGLIRYSRGRITVVDRRGLRAAACVCYRADRQAYERALG